MMGTIYDRLGDLLKETLDAGEVKFVRVEVPGPEEKKKEEEPVRDKKFEDPADFVLKNESPRPEYHGTSQTGTVYHSSDAKTFSQSEYIPKTFVYKKLTPEVENAYRILDIPTGASPDEIKKAYKDKIKYYHPDRYAGNDTLSQVATNKTRQIVEAYKVISGFLEI